MFKLLQCRVLLSALQLPLQLAYPVACLDSILQAKHTLGRVGELKWAFLCIPFTLETGSPSLLFITTPTSLLLLGAALHFCSFPPAKPLALHCAWLRAGCLLFFFFPYIQCRPSCLFSPGMALPLSIFSPACSLHDTCCCFLLGVQFKSFFFSAHQQWSNLRMKDQLSILLLHVPEPLLIPGLRLLPCSTINFQPSEILLL